MAYTDIDKPSDYFNTVLYTGNDTDDHAITGVNFKPDFVWIKSRSVANNHNLYDVIRGVNKPLKCNSTASEFTRTDALKSFDSDGFTLDDDGVSDEVNNNGVTYASWNWKAGGSASSNSNGTITSSVSANTDAGFSIGTYNGSGSDNTVGHGLGVAPDMIIVKCKSTAHDWVVYHSALGNAKILTLNATTVAQSATGWQSTSPTSTVFSIDNAANSLNQSGQSFVFYAMASKKGYSKFGSYVGNGNVDGTFIYTGFKPAWVMIKRTDSAKNWLVLDNKINTHNPYNKELSPNLSAAEATNIRFDSLSNGFKLRLASGASNASGGTYIYAAFAENPFVTSTGVPATAR
jgi:hypothetical protein